MLERLPTGRLWRSRHSVRQCLIDTRHKGLLRSVTELDSQSFPAWSDWNGVSRSASHSASHSTSAKRLNRAVPFKSSARRHAALSFSAWLVMHQSNRRLKSARLVELALLQDFPSRESQPCTTSLVVSLLSLTTGWVPVGTRNAGPALAHYYGDFYIAFSIAKLTMLILLT